MNREYVTIVSGLPRSGTSMMMRMIGEGGIPLLTDQLRTADEDNPNGYLEFEPVKKIQQDAGWLADARGKAVKMVHLLLLHLPLTYRYRIVFMRRDLHEVICSQNRMLARSQAQTDDLTEQRMVKIYEAQIQRVLTHLRAHPDCFQFLEVNYNAVLENPRPHLKEVSSLLDRLNVEKMLAAIDPTLYRNRGMTATA